MRVVLTTHEFYPQGIGGVSRYAESIGQALRARGHQVSLLTTRSPMAGTAPGATYEDGDWNGLPLRRLSFNLSLAPNPYRFEWDNPWVNERILEFVRQERAEIVHMVHGGQLSMSSVPLLKAEGVAVLASVLDYWFICAMSILKRATGDLCEGPDLLNGECIRCVVNRPWTKQDRTQELVKRAPNLALKGLGLVALVRPDPPGRWASVKALMHRLGDMRGYLAMTDAVLCPSEFIARLFRRNGFSEANLRILPLGVQPPRSIPVRRDRRPGDVLRIGYLARLDPAKGTNVLIDAVRSLPHDQPLELQIFGHESSPGYEAEMRARASSDPRIRFLGGVSDPYEALTEMDVLVMPSIWYEGFPLVVRDAQAFGLPVIASDLGGLKEGVRDEVDGLLFRAGDSIGLARHLRRLLDDPALLGCLRANVRPPLTTEEHLDRLLEHYHSALQSPTRLAGTA